MFDSDKSLQSITIVSALVILVNYTLALPQIYQHFRGLIKYIILLATRQSRTHFTFHKTYIFESTCDAEFGSTYKTKQLINCKYNSDNRHDVIILKTYKVSTKEHFYLYQQ